MRERDKHRLASLLRNKAFELEKESLKLQHQARVLEAKAFLKKIEELKK